MIAADLLDLIPDDDHTKLHRSIIDARTERNTATHDATPPPTHLLDDHTLFDHEHERTDA